MKIFRPLAASLIASALVVLLPAQQSDDLASLRAKAEKGNGIAQYNLGLAYAEGRGVAADRLEAFVWLSLARENGARGRAYDTLLASLDAPSLEAARQRLAQHQATAGIPVVTLRPASDAAGTGASAETTAAAADSAALQHRIAALTADKKQLSEEVAKAWKEIDALNAALLKAQRTTRTTPAPASATESADTARFSQALEASLKRTNEQRDALEQKLGAAQKQLAALTADLAAVRASETNLHDTIAQLQQDKARQAATPPYPDLSSRVGELQAQLARAHTNLETAGAAALAASKQNAIDLSASTAQVAQLQKALAAKSTAPAYPDLSGKVRELEAAATQAAAKAREDDAQLRRERDELATRANQLAGETTRLRADAERIKPLEAEAARLTADLAAARNSAPAYPDLSGNVRELEHRIATVNRQADAAVKIAAAASKQSADDLAAATAEAKAAAQEVASVSRARDEAIKHRGPAYPNLAGRVVELQTALADTTRELKDTQETLTRTRQTQAAAPAAVVASAPNPVIPEPAAADTSGQEALQKQLHESENKLESALRGYALLQREVDTRVEAATKGAEVVATERDALAGQVAALTTEVEQLKSTAAAQAATAKGEITQANESLAALQRSTAQNTADLAAARALLQQVQGASTVLARENYQLKARLSPGGPVEKPVVSTAPMVSPPAARTHTVVAGDTLSRISQRYYDTPARWPEIYKVNADKLGPNGILRIGMELVVP